MPLGIMELIRRVGEDNVRIQNIHNALAGARVRKGGATEVSFLTDEITPGELLAGDYRNIGLVLWLPRELVDRARREHADSEAQQ